MSGAPHPDARHLRPSFTLHTSLPREEAIETLRASLAESTSADCWKGKGRWCEIHLPDEEQRFWSPHLSLRLDHEEGGSSIFGRFAPKPEVWTFFMFLYFALAFGVVLGGILGYVQWASNESAWGLWFAAVGLPAIAAIHVAGAVGQRLGQDQMVALKGELDEVIRELGLHPVQREE